MKKKQLLKSGMILLMGMGLSACGSNSSESVSKVECSDCAVITTVATDWSSSGIDFIETSFPYSLQSGFAEQDLSDIQAVTYGDHFYRLGKYQQDNLSKWSFDNASGSKWEFSLGAYSNPYDVIFVSETKAYILLWGANEIWIIDPSVENNSQEANFKTASIDLSAYDQGAGSNAAAAVIDNGYLYVLLEGLDSNYAPQTSYLIKIDTMSDTEVDVNGSTLGNGFALTVKNAGDLDLFGNSIYVAGKGRYAYDPRPLELTGGIEKIDISGSEFSSSLLVDDDHTNVAAQITELEIVNDNVGYFLKYNDSNDIDLMRFNPSTGEVDANPLNGYSSKDVRFIEVDSSNQLWIGIGDFTSPHIDILSTVDESLNGSVNLRRNPTSIRFADTTN